MRIVLVALTSCILLTGCATSNSEERLSLIDKPADCESAEQSVASLEAARPSSLEQARSALQMLTPIGLVSGALTGQLDDRAKVATGSMSRDIDEKIDAIEQSCLSDNSADQNPTTQDAR